MKLTIGKRLLLSSLIFIIPVVVLGYFVISGIQGNVSFAENEKRGNDVYLPLNQALNNISRHRVLLTQHSLNIPSDKNEAESLVAAIDKNIKDYESIANANAEPLKLTDAQLESQKKDSLKIGLLGKKWSDLKVLISVEWKASAAPSEKLLEQYNGFISTLRGTIAHIADKSNLILDPDLDSYYLMEATIVFSPDIIDWIHAKQALLNTQLTSGQATEVQIRDTLSVLSYYLNEYFSKRIEGDIDTVFSEDANFYGSLASLEEIKASFESYKASRENLLSVLKSINPGQPVNLANINDSFDKYLQSTFGLWTVSQKNLNGLLDARMDDMGMHMKELLAIGALFAVIAAIIFTQVLKSVTAPLRDLEHSMKTLASGNLETQIPHLNKEDEIGDMSRALSSFKDTAIKAEQLRSEQQQENDKKLKRNTRVEDLIKQFESKSSSALSMVSSAASSLFKSSKDLLSAATNSSGNSVTAASEMEQSSHNVKAVAAAAEELSAAINEISGQVHKSAEISHAAVDKTNHADVIANELSESARKIGDVIKIISDIASQINLLALNATIESARAGEAGKGFAVVASEVKNLAAETTKATEEISQQISGMQKVSGTVVEALQNIRETISQMRGISVMIASAVEEQGAATQEIARNIQNASDSVQRVSDIIDKLQADSKNTNSSAELVSDSAQLFTDQANGLKNEVEGFLNGIKAA